MKCGIASVAIVAVVVVVVVVVVQRVADVRGAVGKPHVAVGMLDAVSKPYWKRYQRRH